MLVCNLEFCQTHLHAASVLNHGGINNYDSCISIVSVWVKASGQDAILGTWGRARKSVNLWQQPGKKSTHIVFWATEQYMLLP